MAKATAEYHEVRPNTLLGVSKRRKEGEDEGEGTRRRGRGREKEIINQLQKVLRLLVQKTLTNALGNCGGSCNQLEVKERPQANIGNLQQRINLQEVLGLFWMLF